MAAPLISLDTLFSDGFDLYPSGESQTGTIAVSAPASPKVPTVGVTPQSDDLAEKDKVFQLLLRKFHGQNSR